MIVLLGWAACALALSMAVLSGVALHRAEHAGRNARPYVLPVFVGIAYVLMRALVLHDDSSSCQPQQTVEAVEQFIQTMLILSVILLLQRGTRRRG